jgi:ribosomal protein S18 acetylase RimI-like enzyme
MVIAQAILAAMYEPRLRRALPTYEDARAVADIEAASLGDSDRTVGEIRQVLALPRQYVYLADDSETPVGFLATFETPAVAATRLELDMLGVLEGWRCRGIAQALIRHAMREATTRGTGRFRAVVANDNVASRRAFECCGLRATTPIRDLLTCVLPESILPAALPGGWSQEWYGYHQPGLHGPGPYPHLTGYETGQLRDAHGRSVATLALLRVDTVAYSGYWIEQFWATDSTVAAFAAQQAVARAQAEHLDEVGVLLPQGSIYGGAYRTAGYDSIGEYSVMRRDGYVY